MFSSAKFQFSYFFFLLSYRALPLSQAPLASATTASVASHSSFASPSSLACAERSQSALFLPCTKAKRGGEEEEEEDEDDDDDDDDDDDKEGKRLSSSAVAAKTELVAPLFGLCPRISETPVAT